MKLTWETFKNHSEFTSLTIECPITSNHIAACIFGEQYAKTLETFDGADCDSWFDVYFEQSPLVCTQWRYKNERMRKAFYELCLEDGCINDIQLEQEGWTSEAEKQAHREHERRAAQREVQMQRKKQTLSFDEKEARIINTMKQTIATLQAIQKRSEGQERKLRSLLEKFKDV